MADNLQPTTEDLARDAAADMVVVSAATPGPWDDNGAAHCGKIPVYTLATDVGYIMTSSHFGQPEQARTDAVFIALARTALPAWIRRAIAAEAEVARLRDAMREIVKACDFISARDPDTIGHHALYASYLSVGRVVRATLDAAPTS